MKKNRLILRMVVLGVIFIALAGAFYTAYTNDDSPVKVGELAPDFTLINLQGEEVKLSDWRGKGVMINFWATWCEPCRTEMPHMEAQYQQMKEQGIEIIAVNIAESELAVSAFAKRLQLSFPILLDTDKSITNRYGVGPIPTSFFIDKDGVVVEKVPRMMNERQIEYFLHLIKPQ